jgi:hypothetical protein
LPCLDAALRNDIVPLVMAVEVAKHRPDTFDGRIDDSGANNPLQHP